MLKRNKEFAAFGPSRCEGNFCLSVMDHYVCRIDHLTGHQLPDAFENTRQLTTPRSRSLPLSITVPGCPEDQKAKRDRQKGRGCSLVFPLVALLSRCLS